MFWSHLNFATIIFFHLRESHFVIKLLLLKVCEMQICKGYTANSRISDMVSLDIRQNPKHLVEWFCISAAHTTD